MPQNIYDDDEFYAGYQQLPRSVGGLHAAPEWPVVHELLPDLAGAKILDLGCGFGAFDRWAARQGAEQIIAVDVSSNMLKRARELTDNSLIDYRQGDIGALDIPESEFDLIYSALAIHYIEDLHTLCQTMRAKLREGGQLIATLEHPIFSAPRHDQWQTDAQGNKIWPLDGYLREGARTRSWFTDGVIKYHRSTETYVNTLLDNSFRLNRLIEWGPDEHQLAQHPEWACERDRPMFMILAATAVL